VGEAADGAVLVLPGRTRDARDAVVLGDLGLVDRDGGELTGGLVPLEGLRLDRLEVDVAAKVARPAGEEGESAPCALVSTHRGTRTHRSTR